MGNKHDLSNDAETAFSDQQYALAYPEGIERHWWTLGRTRILLQALKHQKLLDKPVLEVGAGRGVVVKMLRDRGVDCQGVELASIPPLPDLEEYMTCGCAAEQLPQDQRLRPNCILLLDVIEHIEQPGEFIRTLLGAFPNVTDILVTVPARQELWSNYDSFYDHYRRYGLDMLEDLGRDLGATEQRQRYFFHSLYWPALLLSKLGLDRSTRIKAPAPASAWIHAAMASVFTLEYRLLPGRFYGSSALAWYKFVR